MVRSQKWSPNLLQKPERHESQTTGSNIAGRNLQDYESGRLEHVRNRHRQEDVLFNGRFNNGDGGLGEDLAECAKAKRNQATAQ